MNIEELYAKISGNYQEALTRMLRESLVERFVLKFANDKSFAELEINLQAGNTELAFQAAHSLKGVCKNLAFTKLADSSSEITELLRAGNLEAARIYLPIVEEDYDIVIEALGKLS